MAASDWQGARNDFKALLQYFPEDNYSKGRLAAVEAKIAELAQLEQQKIQRANEEQQSRQKTANLRLSALNSYRVGSYQKSISEWQEYLKFEPNSDEAYFYLGANYQDQKQLDTAILNFEKCLSLNPGNVLAHLNLGLLYDYHRNNFKQAEEHLRKAKELGGAEKYSPDRLQSMIQDLQDRAQAFSVLKMLFPGRSTSTRFPVAAATCSFPKKGWNSGRRKPITVSTKHTRDCAALPCRGTGYPSQPATIRNIISSSSMPETQSAYVPGLLRRAIFRSAAIRIRPASASELKLGARLGLRPSPGLGRGLL